MARPCQRYLPPGTLLLLMPTTFLTCMLGAPTATSVASWSISYRLDGYIPSLAQVQNGGDVLATSDCSTETFGRVEQISHSGAVALMTSMTPGSGTRAPRR